MILPGIGCTSMMASVGNIGTWDPAAKGAVITLSNGNLTQSPSGTGSGMALNTVGRPTGKLYAEAVPVAIANQEIMFGLANASVNLNQFVGFDNNGVALYEFFANSTSSVVKNNALLGTGLTAMTTGCTVGVAVDFSMGLAWFLINGVSADGSTIGSTGGYALPAGTLFVAGAARAASGGASTLTLNSSPTYGPPAAGFTYWV